jgi:hypothetical protein
MTVADDEREPQLPRYAGCGALSVRIESGWLRPGVEARTPNDCRRFGKPESVAK